MMDNPGTTPLRVPVIDGRPDELPLLASTPAARNLLLEAARDALVRPRTGARVGQGRRKVQVGLAVLVTVAALLLASGQAGAQCSMGAGAHAHGADAGTVDRKTQMAIDQILATEAARRAFVNAAMNDTVLMRLLLGRVAQDPQWRSEAATVLGVKGGTPEAQEGAAEHKGEGGIAGSERVAALYACPMHADVTSVGPGTCPKCGMALRRVR